jgi:zinc transport system ATP-binding protein
MSDAAFAPQSPAPILAALEKVSFSYGQRRVLEQVDLEVRKGEIVTLVGPNGAGKSTLLKLILGLLAPDSGTAFRHSRLKVGYVPQRLHVDPILPLTARRFLCLPERQSDARLEDSLAEVGASGLLERPLQDFSGGEMQRLLLARALLRDPDLLILDEPLQGVDIGGQLSLFQLIERVRTRRGCGVILVSHDLHVVLAGTDRVICLNKHVCCSGKPESVSRNPAYLKLFGPESAKGLALYQHHHDHRHDLAGAPLPEAPAHPTEEHQGS